MDLQLKGRVAIVTGASQGIGRAIAETLAAEGMPVAIVARRQEELDQLASTLATECLVQAADLRDPAVPAAVVAAVVKRFGQLDLVVNNAGSAKRGDFLDLTDAVLGELGLTPDELSRLRADGVIGPMYS